MKPTIYQIVCGGDYRRLRGKGSRHSKNVFSDRAKAEEYKEEFRKLCCGDGLMDFDEKTVEVKVIKLELVEGLSEDERIKKDKELMKFNETHKPTADSVAAIQQTHV